MGILCFFFMTGSLALPSFLRQNLLVHCSTTYIWAYCEQIKGPMPQFMCEKKGPGLMHGCLYRRNETLVWSPKFKLNIFPTENA
jgi:hypothetical protein